MTQTIVSLAKAFGQVAREARIQIGLTQEALAHRARLHRTYIGDLENGRKSPTLDVVEALASALGSTPHALIAAAEQRRQTDYLTAPEVGRQ